jgi:hypothetical protein
MYRQTAFAFLLTLVACGASAACSGLRSPFGPSTPSVSGTWSGTITSNQVAGSGPARVTISQTDNNLSGSWSVTGPNGPDSGSLTGSVDGSAVSMTLSPSVPTSCPYTATATVSGNSMTGTYAAFNCTLPVAGGITLTKQ